MRRVKGHTRKTGAKMAMVKAHNRKGEAKRQRVKLSTPALDEAKAYMEESADRFPYDPMPKASRGGLKSNRMGDEEAYMETPGYARRAETLHILRDLDERRALKGRKAPKSRDDLDERLATRRRTE